MCISVTPPPSEAYILSESYLPLDQLLCIDDLLICYKSNLRSELRKIKGVLIFLYFFLFLHHQNVCCGTQKNCLAETILLSTNNIHFD